MTRTNIVNLLTRHFQKYPARRIESKYYFIHCWNNNLLSLWILIKLPGQLNKKQILVVKIERTETDVGFISKVVCHFWERSFCFETSMVRLCTINVIVRFTIRFIMIVNYLWIVQQLIPTLNWCSTSIPNLLGEPNKNSR